MTNWHRLRVTGAVWYGLVSITTEAKMEKNEVSIQEARLFKHMNKIGQSKWVTSKDAAKDSGVNARTARMLLLKLTRMGILECAEVFPAHRYRMAEKAGKRNGGYVTRLEQVCEIFGLQ
jgi:predicted transcriptional regulator of viral defense system